MSDNCLLALAKNAAVLVDSESLIQFLSPWYGMEKHHLGILACLQSTLPSNTGAASKLERKAALKAARASKKIKYMDDPVVAEAAKITAMRDQWLVQRGKATAETKARLKKAADAEKNEREKADKVKEKSQQQQDIRRLAIINHQQIGSFRAILSDPRTETASSDPAEAQTLPSSQTTARTAHQASKAISKAKKKDFVSSMGQRLLNRSKKNGDHLSANAIRATRTPTPPLAQMELIWPGKRRVKVRANAVENTPSKQMRRSDWCN